MKIYVLQFSTRQQRLCGHGCTGGDCFLLLCTSHHLISKMPLQTCCHTQYHHTLHFPWFQSKETDTYTHLSAVGSVSITTDTTESLWRRRLLLSWSCWPSCWAVCCCRGLRLISRGRHFGNSFVIWSLLAPLMQSCRLSNCSRLVMAPRHVPGSTLPPVSVVGTPVKTN